MRNIQIWIWFVSANVFVAVFGQGPGLAAPSSNSASAAGTSSTASGEYFF